MAVFVNAKKRLNKFQNCYKLRIGFFLHNQEPNTEKMRVLYTLIQGKRKGFILGAQFESAV